MTAFAVRQSAAHAQETPVDLGRAAPFAVLGGQTVTNTGPTVVNGDLGVSPGSSVTEFPPGVVNGTIHAADATAAGAQVDLTAAYGRVRVAASMYCPPGANSQALSAAPKTSW
jgi:hypothetical protein